VWSVAGMPTRYLGGGWVVGKWKVESGKWSLVGRGNRASSAVLKARPVHSAWLLGSSILLTL
jgi:hypothetical protein